MPQVHCYILSLCLFHYILLFCFPSISLESGKHIHYNIFIPANNKCYSCISSFFYQFFSLSYLSKMLITTNIRSRPSLRFFFILLKITPMAFCCVPSLRKEIHKLCTLWVFSLLACISEITDFIFFACFISLENKEFYLTYSDDIKRDNYVDIA